jgi:hypothetical protein
VAALVLTQVPNAHVASAVAANELALIGVDDNIVDGHPVSVVALHIAAAGIPDFDGAVFGRRDQPLGLTVKRYAGDVGRVAVECKDGIGVGRLDVVKLDRMVAGGGEVALVGRNAEPVDLRVWVGDGARANAAEGFPKALFAMSVGRQDKTASEKNVPDRVIIAGCCY